MSRIGFVTCQKIPALTGDDALAVERLRQLEIEAVPAVWSAPEVDWKQFDAAIIRSCWDYQDRPDEFRAWVERMDGLGVPLWNPARIVQWNVDKRYLQDLAARGVTIPRTIWVESGSRAELSSLLRDHHLERAVVKPTISATAKQTWLTSPETAPAQQPLFARMSRTSGVMVQSFLEEIAEVGEWSLLFFGGRYSHAVQKLPKNGDFRVQSDFGGTARRREPPGELIRQAESILRLIDAPLLYSRVDGLYINDRFTLLELELIEPELFLRLDRAAPERFARSIAAALSIVNELT